MKTVRLFRRAFLAATLFLPASRGECQRTWIVDQSNGPGTHWTDLPPAVSFAKDGDAILIRKGTYQTAVVGKALTILGEAGAKLDPLKGRPRSL